MERKLKECPGSGCHLRPRLKLCFLSALDLLWNLTSELPCMKDRKSRSFIGAVIYLLSLDT